jgi:hypothetical protein
MDCLKRYVRDPKSKEECEAAIHELFESDGETLTETTIYYRGSRTGDIRGGGLWISVTDDEGVAGTFANTKGGVVLTVKVLPGVRILSIPPLLPKSVYLHESEILVESEGNTITCKDNECTIQAPPPKSKVSYGELLQRAKEELGDDTELLPGPGDKAVLEGYLKSGEVASNGGRRSVKKRVTRRGRKLVITRRRRTRRRKLDRFRSLRGL